MEACFDDFELRELNKADFTRDNLFQNGGFDPYRDPPCGPGKCRGSISACRRAIVGRET